MAEIPQAPDRLAAPAPVKLWTPKQIAILSVFLGYPVGLVLSAINWRGLKQTRKGIIHLIAGFGILSVWISTLGYYSVDAGLLVLAAIDLGFIYYLYRRMTADIREMEAEGGGAVNTGWPIGCLVSLLVWVLIYICLRTIVYLALAP
jgi:hypothetical protein